MNGARPSGTPAGAGPAPAPPSGGRIETLLRTVRELGAARDVAGITTVVRRAARQLTGADGVSIVLKEGDECVYADEDAIAPLFKGKRFPLDACISGWVIQHGQRAVVADIGADARIPQDVYRPTFVKSLVMLPVGAPEPVAAIGAYWSRPHTASAPELDALDRLADSTALALQNMSLRSALAHERRKRLQTEATLAAARRSDELIPAVAHELRQPLQAAGVALHVIAGRHDDPALERAHTVLERQVQQMSRLVDDLLSAGQILHGELRLQKSAVDVRDVIREAIDTTAAAVTGRNHRLDVALPETAVVIDADPSRLQQVLVNLIGNAAKYTPDAGEIQVRVTAASGGVTIRVKDNGVGIPAEELPTIFDVFTRAADRKEKGLGLGLAIARNIVEQHGGTLEADSEGAGRGSEFIVRLPLSRR